MGDPLSVEKLLAIALYRWASASSLRVVADVFRVGITTVYRASLEVAEAIKRHLYDEVIRYAFSSFFD